MKVLCDTKLLNAAVSNVSRAVASRSTIPALEGILIVAQDSSLTLSGYDLEIGITTKINATISRPGRVVLNAKLLSEIVRKMPSGQISISVDNNNVAAITSGITQFSITALDSDSFPDIPSFDNDDLIMINAGVFKNMINQTIFAIAINDTKPVHMGSLLKCEDGQLTMVSVDGIKLALKKTKINYNGFKSFVIPGKTLSEISKLITNLDETIKINVSDKHVLIEIEDYKVTSRLLEGEFLDYKSAIPQDHSTSIIIKPADLINIIDRISLIIFDKLKAPVRLSIDENIIKFYCSSPTGNAYDELPCEINGNSFDIGFNSKALLDALRVIEDENIKLLFNGPLSPMKIVPVDNDDFTFLVLPVRIKNDDMSEN